jgi:hypothetical protein
MDPAFIVRRSDEAGWKSVANVLDLQMQFKKPLGDGGAAPLRADWGEPMSNSWTTITVDSCHDFATSPLRRPMIGGHTLFAAGPFSLDASPCRAMIGSVVKASPFRLDGSSRGSDDGCTV